MSRFSRLTAWAIALVMIVGLIPAGAVSVGAADASAGKLIVAKKAENGLSPGADPKKLSLPETGEPLIINEWEPKIEFFGDDEGVASALPGPVSDGELVVVVPERSDAPIPKNISLRGGSSGTADTASLNGSGTETDPWKISTAEDLMDLAAIVNGGESCAGKTVRLTKDVDLSSVCGGDVSWEPIGRAWDIPFDGVFDGDGHSLTGLFISGSSDYAGLFGHVTGTVRKLNVSGSVSGGNYVGGIAGCCYGTLENCSFSGTVSGGDYVGGAVGCAAKDSKIINCSSSASVGGFGTGIGGIVGWANNVVGQVSRSDALSSTESEDLGTGLIEKCSFSGEVTGVSPFGHGTATSNEASGTITITVVDNAFGGIVGWNNGSTVRDCSNSGEVNGDDFAGGIVGDSSNGGSIENCTNTGKVTGASMLNGGITGRLAEGAISGCKNSGAVTGGDFTGGIAGAADKYSTFSGCENLTGAAVTGGEYTGGVVGIANCAITDCSNSGSVSGSYGVGGVVGWTIKDVLNCHNKSGATVTGTRGDGRTGGVAGNAYGIIENCSNAGTVNGTDYVGGIAGYIKTTVKNSSNTGTVSGDASVGGVVGSAESTSVVTGCTNGGKVTGKTYTGGVVGIALCVVRNCSGLSLASVTGTETYTGGVVGYLAGNGKAELISNSGKVEGVKYVGGLIGMFPGTISGVSNSGQVSGEDYVGGVAGYAEIINDCHNNAEIKGNMDTGGVAGACNGEMTSCTNNGPVSGDGIVGGVAGGGKAKFKDDVNKGTVTGTGLYLGGVIGYASSGAGISGCSNESTVSGEMTVGGVVGCQASEGFLSDCHNTGSVSGTTQNAGGIIGEAFSPITGCTNAGSVNGLNVTGGIVGVGQVGSSVDNCQNLETATVEAEGASAGGIAGLATCEITACTNSGTVKCKNNSCGGVAGYALFGAKVASCSNTGKVNGNIYAGGVVGMLGEFEDGADPSGTVENCTNSGTVTGGQATGGVIGGCNGTVKGCDSRKSPTGGSSTGGIAGLSYGGAVISDCTNRSAVTANGEQTGGIIGTNAGTVTGCENQSAVAGGVFTTVGGIVGGNVGTVSDCTNKLKVSSNASHTGGIAGVNQGTLSGCANKGEVTNAAGSVGGIVGENGGTVSGCENTGNVSSKTSGEVYAGGIAGRSYGTVKNCRNSGTLTAGKAVGGIIGILSGSGKQAIDCKNEGIINGPDGYAGGIVGNLNSNCSVSGCTNKAPVKASGKNAVGGIVGKAGNNITVSNCSNYAYVEGNESTGGIVGGNGSSGKITGCVNDASVTGGYDTGGIIGDASADITNCTNKASVTGSGTASGNAHGTGGIAGRMTSSGTVSKCLNEGDVSGTILTGGIVGISNNRSVTECRNEGRISSRITSYDDAMVGGIIGYISHASVKKCVNDQSFSAGKYSREVGGIVGRGMACTIELCRNYESITGNTDVGGIAAYVGADGSASKIHQCINSGDVNSINTGTSGNSRVGGILGYGDWGTQITQCVNDSGCKIDGEGKSAGGIVGYLKEAGKVSNSYNKGEVEGYNYVGGIAGDMENGSAMEYCMSYIDNSQISCGAGTGRYRGALVGWQKSSDSITLTYNYYINVTSLYPLGLDLSYDVAGKYIEYKKDGFKKKSNFKFDFDNVWAMGSNSPYLRFEGSVPTDPGPDDTPEEQPSEIRISNYEELCAFRDKVNSSADFSKTTVYLCADIDLRGENWEPIGNASAYFTGKFDGQGHTVYNLAVNMVGSPAGFFGVNSGTVRNLGVRGSVMAKGLLAYTGGVVGLNSGTVTSCAFSGGVEYKSDLISFSDIPVGGVVGYALEGTVSNCYSDGEVKGGTYTGGIVGLAACPVEKCFHYTGSVSGGRYYNGAVAGAVTSGAVRNCFALSGTAEKVLGFCSDYSNVSFKSESDSKGLSIVSSDNLGSEWVKGETHPELIALSYTATLAPNGGSGNAFSYGVSRFGDGKLPACPFTNGTKYFIGWNTKADGTGTAYDDRGTLSKNETLYAMWSDGYPYNTFTDDSGALVDNNSSTVWECGSLALGGTNAVTFTAQHAIRPFAIVFQTDGDCSAPPAWRLEAKVRDGDAWKVLAENDGTSLAVGGRRQIELKNVGDSYYSIFRIIWSGPSEALRVKDAFFLVKDLNRDVKMPLILHANDGTDRTENSSVLNGASAVLSNPFDSTEKFFLGWNTNANGTGKFYPHYSNLNVMGLTDLYGQWITASRYVKYNALKAYDSTTATVDGVPDHDNALSGKNNENYTMLVDGDETTKWCFSPRTDSTWYLEFETKDYITPVGYALVTANDTARYTGRNPKNWALEGLNGNGVWVVIDEVTDDTTLPGANYVQMVRSVRCAGEYCRFRISFRGLVSGSTFQLSELFLLTDGGARQPVLTFDPHGGEGSMAQAARPNYSSARLPANTFVREGYDFAGWNTKADGSGVAYRDEVWYRIDGDATLYAQWSKSPFRIVFLGEDGTTLFEDTVDAGALPVYRGPAPVKDADADASYVFSGWNPVIVPVKENTEYRVRFDRVANTYGDPVWTWSSDHKSATAVFTCINNPDKVERVVSNDVQVTSTPATCTDDGQNVYSASVSFLGKTYTGSDTVTVRALGHDIINHTAKAPTCTDVGWDAYDTCSRCSYSTYAEKAALGHDYQSAVTEPTCTEQGFTTHTCSRCGDTYTDDTVPATGHDYKLAGWIWTGFTSAKAKFICSHDASHVKNVNASISSVRTEPTAEKEGSVVYTAAVTFEGVKYTDNKTEIIAALGHDYVLDGWTWTGYGKAEAKFIDNNGGEPITLEGGITNVRTEPTCVKTGKVVYTASVIFEGAEYTDNKTETLKALGHDLTHHDAKAPTCTEIGWDAYDTCSRCDYSTYVEKAALGHDLTHHDAKAPTCTEIGWDAYDTCSRCDYTTFAEKAALGHDMIHHDAKAPTCTEIGWDAYDACSRCDLTTYAEKPAIGHEWGEPSYKWSDDLTECTASAVCTRDGSHVLTKTVKTNFVLTNPSTFETEGAGYYIASFENAEFEEQRKDVTVPAVSCPGGDDCPGKAFTELPPITSYMHVPIDWAIVNRITYGATPTTFEPDKVCTRAQFVTFLWRTAGQPEPARTDNPFKDVKSDSYYYKAVLWAVEQGITLGTSKTTFTPNAEVTRGQVATFLWRCDGKPDPVRTDNPFVDAPTDAYYYPAVVWAVEKGITTGVTDDTFEPGSGCTRAQCVTFLYRQFGQD